MIHVANYTRPRTGSYLVHSTDQVSQLLLTFDITALWRKRIIGARLLKCCGRNTIGRSMSAVYTMFKDKKMELMIFATGNIYRETGTASKEIEDKTFSMRIKREKTTSKDKATV